MYRFGARLAATLLAMSAVYGFAQSTPPARTEPLRPAAKGEPWTAYTLYEYYDAGASQPSKRDRTQKSVCVVRGKFGLSNATSTDLPEEYRDKCWVNEERKESNREQVKYACSDGMVAEAVTRREADGSFGSKFVINIPGKGGVAVTRTFRKASGDCDLSKVMPEVPVSPFKAVPPTAK